MEIRELRTDEHENWLCLRERLWPASPHDELIRELQEILATPQQNVVFVAATPARELVGFAEVSIRDWAEGCRSRPVGYLEGWYVEPGHRRSGVGRRLLEAAERWSAERGCTEMGSDAELDNAVSRQAHHALGFSDVGAVMLFAKKISSDP